MPSTSTRILASRWTKVLVFLLCLSPVGYFAWRAFHAELTANPVEYMQHFSGEWTIRFLVFTLAISPLRKLLNLPDLIRFRRMLGLFAFFYLCLHFLTYLGPDQSFDFAGMLVDIQKRRFITVGILALLLMIPLAVTSTSGWIRRLGGKNWQLLHRLVYVIAALGVIHYYWLVKSDVRWPLFYATLVALLLLYRAFDWRRKRTASTRTSAPRVAVSAGK